MTVFLTLPTAWQPDTAADGPRGAAVPLDDLVEGLGALADAADATRYDLLLAAHVKVLTALTEDTGTCTRAIPPGGGPAVAVPMATAATWCELVRSTSKALRSADPVRPGPGARRADTILFGAGGGDAGGYGLHAAPVGAGLRLAAAAGAITAERFATLGAMYRLVLEAMAAGPDGDALAAPLPAAERQLVLRTWARGTDAPRGPESVDRLIRAQAARTPDAPAVRCDPGGLTFRQLDERAGRLAHHLAALGAGPDDLVGVCLRRGPDLLPAFLGVWQSGAACLPLDPDLPPERLRLMAESSDCTVVITDTARLPLLDGVTGLRPVLVDGHREEIAARPSTPLALPVRSADLDRLAYVIFTSGSTGTPKGVMVEHRGLANYLLWTVAAYAGRGSGGSAAFSSISFDLGIPNLFTPLLAGQTVHLLPDPLPPAELGERLVAGAPYSFLKMTPGQLDLLSLDLTPEETGGLAGLVIAAGDAFTADLAARWIEAAGPDGTAVATEYGPTEITVGNSGSVLTRVPARTLVPLGAPIPNTTMYVLTGQLEPVPVGVPGEVHIGGAGVARGYLGRPRLTGQRFLADPYGPPGSRLYRTGDRARWLTDGSLEFLGRVDHQIKVRGYRVEPGEVQEQLRSHPGVAEAVVLAHGDGRAQGLAAFLLPAPGAEPTGAELRAHLDGRLPGYMIPARFVTVDRLPLTANGKVDVRDLRSRLEQ